MLFEPRAEGQLAGVVEVADLPPPGLELRRRSLSVGGGFLRSAPAAAEGDPVQLGADRIRVAQIGVQEEGRLETLTAADGSVRDGDAHDDPQRIARVRRLFDAESHARAVQGPEPPLHGGIVVRRPVFRGVALRPLRRPFPPGIGIPNIWPSSEPQSLLVRWFTLVLSIVVVGDGLPYTRGGDG